jgi:hypothetical protein
MTPGICAVFAVAGREERRRGGREKSGMAGGEPNFPIGLQKLLSTRLGPDFFLIFFLLRWSGRDAINTLPCCRRRIAPERLDAKAG